MIWQDEYNMSIIMLFLKICSSKIPGMFSSFECFFPKACRSLQASQSGVIRANRSFTGKSNLWRGAGKISPYVLTSPFNLNHWILNFIDNWYEYTFKLTPYYASVQFIYDWLIAYQAFLNDYATLYWCFCCSWTMEIFRYSCGFLEVPVNERRCSGVDQKLEEWRPKGGLAIGGCMLYPAPVNYHIWSIIISCTNLLINYMFILYLYSHSCLIPFGLGRWFCWDLFREFSQLGGQLVEVHPVWR